MDQRKLDAKLSEALAASGPNARFEVFVEIAGDADADEVDRLATLGVRRAHGDESIVTAELSPKHVGDVSEIRAVRQVRLSRRLRHS